MRSMGLRASRSFKYVRAPGLRIAATKHGRVARWNHLKQSMRMVAEWVNVRGVL